MTFPAFSLSPKFSLDRLLWIPLFLLFVSCSHWEEDDSRKTQTTGRASRFEWGVQYYESGEYSKAIKSFAALRQEGPSQPDFDLFPYYLGLSHFHLGQYQEAALELENFLRITQKKQDRQDALIALLLAYEQLNRWKDASTLSAETDKLTLYHNNRAMLNMVWARALSEQGELVGAKATLEESLPFLEQLSAENNERPLYSNPEEDLWGRYHFTSILLKGAECREIEPRTLEEAAKKSIGKKGKAKAPRRLYRAWLESRTDCLLKMTSLAGDEVFPHESSWATSTEKAILGGISQFESRIKDFLRAEAPSLDRHRELEKETRENLYRLLNGIELQIDRKSHV